jgi:hypothetical protein
VLFLVAVLMAPSSVFITVAAGERLSCDGFSLGETIRFGSLELIADHISGLSLSPFGNGSGTTTMGLACGGPPVP